MNGFTSQIVPKFVLTIIYHVWLFLTLHHHKPSFMAIITLSLCLSFSPFWILFFSLVIFL